jgi:hypothetical protein
MMRISFYVVGISLFVGVYMGLLFDRVPYLTLNPSVSVVELGNLIFMIALAIIIPLTLTYRVDNFKSKKALLASDMKQYCTIVQSISELIPADKGEVVSEELRVKINFLFKKGRAELRAFNDEINKLKCNKLNEQVSCIESKFTDYWEYVTGNEGVGSDKLDDGFFWKQEGLSSLVQREVRKVMFILNEL